MVIDDEQLFEWRNDIVLRIIRGQVPHEWVAYVMILSLQIEAFCRFKHRLAPPVCDILGAMVRVNVDPEEKKHMQAIVDSRIFDTHPGQVTDRDDNETLH